MDLGDPSGGSTEDRRNSSLDFPFPPPPRPLSPLAAPYNPLLYTSPCSPLLSPAPPCHRLLPANPNLGADGGSQMMSLLISHQSSQQALPPQSWWSDTIRSFNQDRQVSIPGMITASSVNNHAAAASVTTQDINGVVIASPQQCLQPIIHDVGYDSRVEDHCGWVSGDGQMMPPCISSQPPPTLAQDHLLWAPSFSPRPLTTLCHNFPLMDHNTLAGGSHFPVGEGEQMMPFSMSLQTSLHSPMGFDGSFSVSPTLSYHTAAVPVDAHGAVVLQQQYQLPMDFDAFPGYTEDSEHLQLDEQIQHIVSTFCSSQPSSLSLSPSPPGTPTEFMNLSGDHTSLPDPDMIPGPAEANQAAAEPIGLGNSTGRIPKPSQQELLHKIRIMLSEVDHKLAQKNHEQLQSLLNFLATFLNVGHEIPQHNPCSMNGSSTHVGIIRLEQYEESTSGRSYSRKTSRIRVYAVCMRSDNVLLVRMGFGTSFLLRHIWGHRAELDWLASSEASKPQWSSFSQAKNIRKVSKNPMPLIKDKERKSEIMPLELGNTEDVQIHPGDMSGKYKEGMKVNLDDMISKWVEDMEVVDPFDIPRNHTEVELDQDGMSRKCMEDLEVQPRDISRKHPKDIDPSGISRNCINRVVVKPFDTSRKQSEKAEVEPGFMSRKRAKETKVKPGDMPRKRAKNVKVESSHMSRKGTTCNKEKISGVWEYMSKDLKTCKAICNRCRTKLSYKNATTTHLLRHLKTHGIVVLTRQKRNQEGSGTDNLGKDQAAAESCGIMPDKVSNSEVIILDSQDTGDTVDKISVLEEQQLLVKINSAPEQEALVQIEDVTIKKNALKSLADPNLEDGPQKYLNDDIIDAYICILKAKNKYGMRAHGRIYIETTMGCQFLCKDSTSISERENKKKRGINYLKHDMIFLPMNENRNHWYLAVINTKTQKIQVLDSLGRKQLQERKELQNALKHCLELASNGVQSGSWPDYKITSWTVTEETQVPKQTDRSSCGLFVIKYIKYWTGEKLSKQFLQADVDVFRRKLAAELMSSPLNTAGN